MGRPRKPQWVVPGKDRPGRFRTVIDGKIHYFPPEIKRTDRPQIGGIPKAAWDYLAEMERTERDKATAHVDPTVGWLCELYLEWAEGRVTAGELSGGQYKGQSSRVNVFTSRSGIQNKKARLITADDLSAFFDSLRGEYTPHYVAGVGRTVRTIFRWGSKLVPGRNPARLLPENPVAGYDFPRAPGAVRGYVQGEVVRRFFRWAWGRSRQKPPGALSRRFDRLFILMLRFQRLTGARPGEACGLLWSDIDWQSGRIVIPWERHKTGKKTKKDRVIYLTAPVIRIIRAIERLPHHHPTHVFTHRRGNRAGARGHADPLAGEPWPSGSAASAKVRAWREEAIAAGVAGLENVGPRKFVAYVHRHGYISDAVSSGLSHEQTADLVGNTAPVIQQTYSHAIGEKDAERARKLMERGKGRGKKSREE